MLLILHGLFVDSAISSHIVLKNFSGLVELTCLRKQNFLWSFKTLVYSLQYVILDEAVWSSGNYLFTISGDEKIEHVCADSILR